MKRLLSLLCILSFFLLASSADAGEPLTPEEVTGRVQNNYETARTMAADFRQVTAVSMSSRTREGSGRLILQKPGKMRWDYTSPDRQVLICDGKSITMYLEKSRQMVISDAREYLKSDVTYGFFTGTGDILRDFVVSYPDSLPHGDDTYVLSLVPRQTHPQAAQILIWAQADTFLISQLRIIDHFNTVTDLYFTNIRINEAKDAGADIFSFTPPPETEIITQ